MNNTLLELERTTLYYRRYCNEILKEKSVGLTYDQWNVLVAISKLETGTQKELSQRTLKDPASITRILDILEKNGTALREAVSNDRRSYNISLTEAGKSIIRKVNPLLEEINTSALKRISKSNQKVLSECFYKIQNNIN